DSAPGPVHTTAGSPNLRASVTSSSVTFLIVSPSCSASIRISAIVGSPSAFLNPRSCSDELAAGQELGRLAAAIAVVGHDLARLPRRPLGEAQHLAGRVGEANLTCIHADVGHAH